jgi:peptide/nickel transport system substrate-binding protein
MTLKPELATSWEANDDLSSFTFHLREGVKFHHGKDFKAEDVLFSFERLMDPVIDSPARSTFEKVIEDIVAVDDYTVRFDLSGPNGFFLESLTIFQARIVASDVDPKRLHTETFGTGPFKILEHLQGQRTVFVRNDDYWDEGLPYLDEIVFLAIPEAATRIEALKSGDIDLVFNLDAQSVASVEGNANTTVLRASTSAYIGMDMNNTIPPFDNKLVRQAMQAATDREAIRQAMFFGLGSPAYDHPVPPNDPRFAPQYKPLDYNPDLARSLLEQAGYPDGLDIELYTADLGSGMLELAVAFKESAAPAGIRVDVQRVASDGFWDQYWMQKPFTVVIWLGRANPDLALSAQYLSDSTVNAPRYNNPTFDALVVKARGESLEDQKVTYAEIQRILIDEVPRLVVAFQPWLYGARINVRGAPPHPLGWAILQDAWLDN